MQTDPLDLVGIIAVLLAYIASKELASAVSPYAAIALLACAGATLSLSGAEDKMSVVKAVWFVGLRVVLAIAITISVAELLQNVAPWMKPRYTLSPIAFGIGWIRDYNQIRSWLGSVIDRFTTRRIDDGK